MALPEPEGAVPPEDRPGQGRGSEVPEPIRVFGLGEGPPQSVAANRAAILSGPLGRRPRDLQGFQAAQGRGQTWTATGAMSAPPPLQIREANAHLVAVHRRAVELEARLDAAERTVRSQAERLARHDEQLRAALDELGRAKDREIAALQEQLLTSEATVQSLQAAVQQRDKLIRQLQPRAELLQNICRQRPPLAGLLAALAEAERLGPLPASDSGHPFSGAPSLLLANSTEEEGDRDHLQPAVFGTTV